MSNDIQTLKQNHSEQVYRYFFPSWDGKNINCFAHDDKNPSLSIYRKNGEYRHHCHACEVSGDCLAIIGQIENISDIGHQIGRLKEIAGTAETKKTIEAVYDYKDAEGNFVFQTVRYKPKDFKQRRPDGKGGWIYSLQGVQLVPYNLPEVIKSKYVIVVEGEGKVEILKGIGLVASCSPLGAGKWEVRDKQTGEILRPYNGYFRDKKVYIIGDNDQAGSYHALMVASNLKGIASEVKIVELHGLPEKGDVKEWVAQGGTKEKLIKIINETPEWVDNNPGFIRLDTVASEKVSWLWLGFIPLGKITLIDGDPGLGKSLFSIDLIARITSKQNMPDGSPGINGGAVLLQIEDGLADTIVPRLEVAGGNKSRVIALRGVQTPDGSLRFPTVEDVEAISKAIHQVRAKVVVIDPLMGFLNGKYNSWKDQDIRQALSPLVMMAEKEEVAVIVIRHLNKANHSNAVYRGGGTIGIIGVARAAYLIAKNPNDEQKRIFAPVKNNLTALPNSLAYVIENINGIPRITWEGMSNHTANDLLLVPTSQEEISAIDEAKEFLEDLLSDGAVKSKEVIKQAGAVGIYPKTLQRAKKSLGVISSKSGFEGNWTWALPIQDSQDFPKMDNIYTRPSSGNLTIFEGKSVCDTCMLTPLQRALCEVIRPCPKEATNVQGE